MNESCTKRWPNEQANITSLYLGSKVCPKKKLHKQVTELRKHNDTECRRCSESKGPASIVTNDRVAARKRG